MRQIDFAQAPISKRKKLSMQQNNPATYAEMCADRLVPPIDKAMPPILGGRTPEIVDV